MICLTEHVTERCGWRNSSDSDATNSVSRRTSSSRPIRAQGSRILYQNEPQTPGFLLQVHARMPHHNAMYLISLR